MGLIYETFCLIALMFSVDGGETAGNLFNPSLFQTTSMKRVS